MHAVHVRSVFCMTNALINFSLNLWLSHSDSWKVVLYNIYSFFLKKIKTLADTAKVWFSFLGRGIRCDKNSGSILDHVPATAFIIKKVLTYGVFAQSNSDVWKWNISFPLRAYSNHGSTTDISACTKRKLHGRHRRCPLISCPLVYTNVVQQCICTTVNTRVKEPVIFCDRLKWFLYMDA